MDPLEKVKADVHLWLFKNKDRLKYLSIDQIMAEALMYVHNAALLPTVDLRVIIAIWAPLNLVTLPPVGPPRLPSVNSKLIDTVKDAIGLVIDGVPIVTRGDGKISIGVQGLTAELKNGDKSLAVGVSLSRALSVEAKSGDFRLNAELSSNKWELKFTYPEENEIPDMSKLGKVFSEGGKAVVGIYGAAGQFGNLSDIPKVKAAVEPFIKPAKDAVAAVKGIAKAKPGRLNFGFSIGSPDPMPGQQNISPGVQVVGVITLTF